MYVQYLQNEKTELLIRKDTQYEMAIIKAKQSMNWHSGQRKHRTSHDCQNQMPIVKALEKREALSALTKTVENLQECQEATLHKLKWGAP